MTNEKINQKYLEKIRLFQKYKSAIFFKKCYKYNFPKIKKW